MIKGPMNTVVHKILNILCPDGYEENYSAAYEQLLLCVIREKYLKSGRKIL